MDFPTSMSVSVGIVTFGLLALGIIRMFRNKNEVRNPGNPGNKNSVPRKECEAHREGLDKQIKITGESLSREIELTREVLVREIGEVKEALSRREN